MTVHVPPPASVDLDQARRFLAKAVPWPVNGEGYINITWSEKKPGTETSTIWSGRACRTLDEAMGALTWITKTRETRNLRLHELAAARGGEDQPKRLQVLSADPQPAKRDRAQVALLGH